MNEIKTYHWKELSLEKEYNEITQNISEPINTSGFDFSFILPFLEDKSIIDLFIKKYSFFTISNLAKDLIDLLLEKYKIHCLNSAFYLLSAIFQEVYINYFESPADMAKPLYKDYQNEKKDLEVLLDILYSKLNSGNALIKSISFKTDKTRTIDNSFVIKDVFNSLIKYYDLSLENFEIKKKELIENTNQNRLEILDEYHKWLLITSLYSYISKGKDSNSKILSNHIRFAGSFVNIAQIPINKKHFEINLSRDIKSMLSGEDMKYLNTFLQRPKEFFVK